ncbi:MAG: carbon-nitrogen hydrolase family protein [Gammaproteobacteria bacterium]|nr:MAG: carbon-nitrogen hydrolase family protein [Gammaproteobacteria bacterium]
MTKVASLQMISTADVDVNLESASELIAQAANQGAEFLLLPENFPLMGHEEHDKVAILEPFGQGPIQGFLSEQSQKYGIWLMGGTIPLQASVADKIRAACLLYDPAGKCAFRYDKIHLFDATVDEESEESYQESNTLEAGNEIVIAETPFGNIGMTVCYDLRFPELYRAMLKNDVNIITVPSAFTATTGVAHWESLLRARAIENLCYVIASNQGGQHINDRETWGHSMIIDPWGDILDCIEKGPGFAIANIDLERQKTLRRNFPCLEHRKFN